MKPARRWRIQASWKYHGEPRSYEPLFADTEKQAIQIAAEVRASNDDPHFEDLQVRVEEVDAAEADAEQKALEQADPYAYMRPRATNSPESIEIQERVAATYAAYAKHQRRRRPQDAQALLSANDFVSVGPDEITFSDLAAHAFEDLVVETVEFVRTLPGVSDARQEDRELILLSGAFDPASVETSVRQWWVERLRHGAAE